MSMPEDFVELRNEEIERIIKDYPFACMVANTPEGLVANHIPLIFKGGKWLIGHLAKTNPLPQLVERDQEVLCIFTGEEAYISAKDFPKKQEKDEHVPTWNYEVVHVYGKIRFYRDYDSRMAAVGFLTKQLERQVNPERPWKMADAPQDYIMEQLEHVIVFDVTITRVHAKFKLNQRDSIADVEGIIQSLKARGEKGMADAMQKRLDARLAQIETETDKIPNPDKA